MIGYTQLPDDYQNIADRFTDISVIKKEHNGDIDKACSSHPAFFSYWYAGVKLRDYQVYMLDIMLNNSKVMFECARRLGKTTMMMLFDAWALWYNKFPTGIDKTTKIIFMAQTEDSSKDYIRDVKEIFYAADMRVERLLGKKKYFTKRMSKKTDTAPTNSSQISIHNNGWNTLRAYPPTTRARGKPASVIHLDELAFWSRYAEPDEYTVYQEVIRPIITDNPKSRIYIATTPNGPEGLAYELMPIDGHKSVFELIWFPYWIRKDKEYTDSIEEMRDNEYKPQGRMDAFRQEYLAELVVKSDAYFTSDEVENVFNDESMNIYDSSSLPCVASIDFGGPKNSHTVITISALDNKNTVNRIYHKRYPVGKDATIKEDVLAISARFPGIQKWVVDSQGGGSSLYAWFNSRFGGYAYEEVNFRAEKAGMYRQFKIACHMDRIKSYYDEDLKKEMYSFTRDLKPSKGATDDMLDGFVMTARDWIRPEDKAQYTVLTY